MSRWIVPAALLRRLDGLDRDRRPGGTGRDARAVVKLALLMIAALALSPGPARAEVG